MSDFTGKTVLITGASSGIGFASALAFLRSGATVAANHLHDEAGFQRLQSAACESAGRLLSMPADVSDGVAVEEMVEAVVARTGRIDVLVNNAGVSRIKPFLDTDESDWDFILNTDLKSVFLCSRAVMPHLLQSGGAIVNVASELALTGRPGFAPYTAAKGGIISLTRSLALEFAPTVRVNAIAPGPTSTPLLEAENATPGHEEPVELIPLGRIANPEEIAESIVFLASDKATYYCGAVLSPNGGTVMH